MQHGRWGPMRPEMNAKCRSLPSSPNLYFINSWGKRYMADYAASKAGVVALTSAMALDLSECNIRVNSVAPGFILTGMTKKAFGDEDTIKQSET